MALDDHPAGDERHDDAARRAPPGRRPACRGPIDQVVADERAVDVEGDQLDGQDRLRRRDAGHGRSCPTRAACPRDGDAVVTAPDARHAGSPARSGSTSQPQPGSTLGDALDDQARPGPPRSRAAPRRRRRGTSGQLLEQALDDRQPVRPAVERQARLERGGDRQPGHASLRTYGQVRQHEVERLPRRHRPGRRSASLEADPVRDRVPDGVLAGEVERLGRDVDRAAITTSSRHPAPPQRRRPARRRSPRCRCRRRRSGPAGAPAAAARRQPAHAPRPRPARRAARSPAAGSARADRRAKARP